jgi:histone H3/H4
VSRAERLIRTEAKGDQRVSRKACIQLAHYLEGIVGFLLQEAHAHMHSEKRKRLSTADLRHAAEHEHKLHFMRGVHFAEGGSVRGAESLEDMEELQRPKAKRSRK